MIKLDYFDMPNKISTDSESSQIIDTVCIIEGRIEVFHKKLEDLKLKNDLNFSSSTQEQIVKYKKQLSQNIAWKKGKITSGRDSSLSSSGKTKEVKDYSKLRAENKIKESTFKITFEDFKKEMKSTGQNCNWETWRRSCDIEYLRSQ